MNRDHFWLNDRQFARLAPHLPTDTRGKPRVDDRRVISGIVHVLKSGCRWADSPLVYGPRNRLWKNCFSPWFYRHRDAIERMFGGLKDFRRIATRHDRLARKFLATVCLAAIPFLGPHPRCLVPAFAGSGRG